MIEERPTASDLVAAWRDAVRAAELAERLAAAAAESVRQADAHAVAAAEIAHLADATAKAAVRAAARAHAAKLAVEPDGRRG